MQNDKSLIRFINEQNEIVLPKRPKAGAKSTRSSRIVVKRKPINDETSKRNLKNQIRGLEDKLSIFAHEKATAETKAGHLVAENKTKDAAIKILRKRSSLNNNHGIDWCFSADRDRLINNRLGALKLNNTIESCFWTIEGAQLVLVNQGMPLKNQNATKSEKRRFSCNIHNPNIDLFHNNISVNSLKSLEKFDNLKKYS